MEENFLCKTKILLPSIKIKNSKYNMTYFESRYLQYKILKIFQKNHDELKMIFAVLKKQDLRKSCISQKYKIEFN